eukprot:g13891.t1
MAASGELFAKLNKWKSKADEDGLNFEAQGHGRRRVVDRGLSTLQSGSKSGGEDNQGKKHRKHSVQFESVPERSTVDRRADDNKLKLDAAPFVPGGLSSMVGKEVEVTVESATKGGKVGCATWTLRQVVEAADVQSDAFAIPDAAGSWRLHLLNSDEQWSFLKLTRGAGQGCGRSEESEMTKPSSDDPASSPSPAAPHVGNSRQVRVAFFAGKQMSVAEVFEGSGDDGEVALTRQFRKLTSSSASQDSGGLEVGVRWKVT